MQYIHSSHALLCMYNAKAMERNKSRGEEDEKKKKQSIEKKGGTKYEDTCAAEPAYKYCMRARHTEGRKVG